ncbi:MAG: hypothetical protein LBE27_06400 [Deltaproteobacteria bacterium]|jgi:hypothetical protein|nr:hypothetical protein [Deltaproteobacteria bacterium]
MKEKFSKIEAKFRSAKLLKTGNIAFTILVNVWQGGAVQPRFSKKSIELIQDFANYSISSLKLQSSAIGTKNSYFSTYSKMLTDQECKEACQVKEYTSILDAFVDYGIEIGIEEGREIGEKKYMNELTSKLKKLLRAGKSLTDPECLQVLGLTQEDLKSTPTKKKLSESHNSTG